MSLLSFDFIIFFLIIMTVFFILPSKLQWVWLLICSCFFYYLNANILKFIIFLIIIFINYLGSFFIDKVSDNERTGRYIYRALTITDVICLLVFSYGEFVLDLINSILSLFGIPIPDHLISYINLVLNEISPPKISYFMLIILGYITEVYWGRTKAFKNPGKLILFSSYFPIITSGPIITISDVEATMFSEEKHHFSYERFIKGMMRILWGVFKKLVISERLAVFVNTVYSDYEVYPGLYIWIAFILFAFQLYTDFSGLMDIVLGSSEILGIILPENFNTPFYSTSLADFWRNWHITLGEWLRNYVFYSIQRTKPFMSLNKLCKKKLGKNYAKKYNFPLYLSLLITWFLIGLWHGGASNYIFGVGLYMGIIIILSGLLNPLFEKLTKVLRINTSCMSYRLFQRTRTFFIFIFGLSFFRAESLTEGFKMWSFAFTSFNPWILFDRSLFSLGLSREEFHIALFGLLLLFFVSYYQHREAERGTGATVRDLIM
ncbi:MAG: hypothetical protein K6B28_06640, partial [Lachnospiraceae bacterium]|nr:hypothetical protein [Lachnospiraceae bacterium]